ncbi:hypothetical protein CsSME_00002030 [Camellia sinensis var. sinensis]
MENLLAARANIKANQYFYRVLQTVRVTKGALERRLYFQDLC